MNNEVLTYIILGLIGAHYVTMVWEIRRVRDDISKLRDQINAIALASSNAAHAAASAASAAATAVQSAQNCPLLEAKQAKK